MKTLLPIIYLATICFQSLAQTNKSKIDKKDLKFFVKILTADSLEGRGTGTEGQKRAEKIIADRFNSLGLDKYANGSYSEKFKLNQTYWGQVYIKTQNTTLTNFENMVFQGITVQNEEIEKEVIFGGRGTYEDLNQIEVKDRLVLVFVKNLRSAYDISIKLRQRKASGVILANPDNEKQFESIKNTYKDYSLQKRLSLPHSDTTRKIFAKWDTIKYINNITIPNSEIKNLMGRSIKELTSLQQGKRINEVASIKTKVRFERIHHEIETANVIGVVTGKTNKSIIVSAHYDHLGKLGKEYFPGADDNASGIAALLEIAEEFSKTKDLAYTIIFLATSAEEAGLLGSLYHVSQPTFNPKNIVYNLNLDMISRSDSQHSNGKYLYCIGADQSKEIDSILKKADSLFEACSFDYSLNNSKDPLGIFTRSDSYSFYKKGITAIQFFSGLHSDYHKTTDTQDKIDFENLESRVQQISLVIELIQREGLKN
jgi:hypothetical protein